MKLLITVSGSGVTIGEVDVERGQVSCGKFATDNVTGQTLRNLVQKYWGCEHTLVVEDCEFGTGYYTVSTHCGAGGAGYGYRLHPVVSLQESIACHDAAVKQAMARIPVTVKNGLTVAFERAIAA